MKIGRLATCTYVHQRARGEKPINGARLEVVFMKKKVLKALEIMLYALLFIIIFAIKAE
jgi:hypothetical protein